MSELTILELNDNDVYNILKSQKIGYSLISELKAEVGTRKDYYGRTKYYIIPEITKSVYRCFCDNSKGKVIDGTFCPYCGGGIGLGRKNSGHHQLVSGTIKDKWDEDVNVIKHNPEYRDSFDYWYKNYETDISVYSGYYIKKHPEFENGIVLYKTKISISFKKGKEVISSKAERIIEIVPGIKYTAYKTARKSYVECDIFEALNLNTNIRRYDAQIVWEDNSGMIDFLLNNEKFRRQTAVLELFNIGDADLKRNSFFMIYMYLYSQYRSVELLVKMGYYSLIHNVIKNVCNTSNKAEMYNECRKLERIFNTSATRGSMSLCVPKYIGDYLNSGNATLEEYYLWSAIYSYENISKENFFKYCSLKEYGIIFSESNYGITMSKLANMLKYGYKIEKLTKYIISQASKCKNNNYSNILDTLYDYHELAELLELDVECYPSNVIEIHDKLKDAYKISENDIANRQISSVYHKLKDIMFDTEHYTMVIPASVKEFVEEGNAQCNCVASYVSKVQRGECVIFFIRDIEDPESSLITCEYRNGILYQIKAKYNQSVTDSEILNYARKICEKISKKLI